MASESSALLQPPSRSSVWAKKYRNTHKCVSSKAALLVLFCSFAVGIAYGLIYNSSNWFQLGSYSQDIGFKSFNEYTSALYAVIAITYCFYPLAGYLADVKFGRYKTVVRSLYLLLIMIATSSVALAILVPTTMILLSIGFILGIVGFILFIFLTVGFVGFNANVIQFGMDQLHDSPSDHQSLFIHWYMWVYYLGLLLSQLPWTVTLDLNSTFLRVFEMLFSTLVAGVVVMVVLSTILIVLITISLCLIKRKRDWFLIDSGRINPYKLVYSVTKFARQHKVALHRSAFTYCEDEIPSGLDLGKEKYGGPFTTEQVEDVKVFYQMLKLLFSLGPVFFLDISTGPFLYFYVNHASLTLKNVSSTFANNNTIYKAYVLSGQHGLERYMIQDGLLSPLLTVLFIPLYICLLRPFIGRYVPGMLKRIGLGIFLMVLSLVCAFALETATHAQYKQLPCMFSFSFKIPPTMPLPNSRNTLAVLIQLFLSSLSNMLIYISLYEFICSQSPHAMKGFIIGLSFAIKGLFETIGAALVLPFGFKTVFPSCGMNYYLMNIVVGIVALVVYICVARRYKWRQRDEPDNVYRYAEEYYSNTQEEENYD